MNTQIQTWWLDLQRTVKHDDTLGKVRLWRDISCRFWRKSKTSLSDDCLKSGMGSESSASDESVETLRTELQTLGYAISVIKAGIWQNVTVKNWLATKPPSIGSTHH